MQKVEIHEVGHLLESHREEGLYGHWQERYGEYNRTATLLGEDASEYAGEPVFFKDESGKVDVGDFIYVIVARYSSGDSFGNREGVEETLMVVGDKETLKEALVSIDEADKRGDASFEFRGSRISIPWYGYFEHLEDLRVEALLVQ